MNFSFVIYSLAAITTTSTKYGKELLDCGKIKTNRIKHNGQNNTFIFERAKLWKNALSNLVKNFQMGSMNRPG